MTDTKEERLLKFIRKSHHQAIECARFIRFEKRNPQHLYSIALYCRAIGLTESCLILIEQKGTTGLPVILRSLLEAFVDITNLTKNPDYAKNMHARSLAEWIKILEEAGTENNPFLSQISGSDDLKTNLSDWRRELNNLKKEKKGPLDAFKRFEMAGREYEYRSVYNSLCAESHNDVRVLLGRHTEIINESSFRVVLQEDQSLDDIDHYLDAIGLIIVNSSLQVHELLESDHIPLFKDLMVEFDEIRYS